MINCAYCSCLHVCACAQRDVSARACVCVFVCVCFFICSFDFFLIFFEGGGEFEHACSRRRGKSELCRIAPVEITGKMIGKILNM